MNRQAIRPQQGRQTQGTASQSADSAPGIPYVYTTINSYVFLFSISSHQIGQIDIIEQDEKQRKQDNHQLDCIRPLRVTGDKPFEKSGNKEQWQCGGQDVDTAQACSLERLQTRLGAWKYPAIA